MSTPSFNTEEAKIILNGFKEVIQIEFSSLKLSIESKLDSITDRVEEVESLSKEIHSSLYNPDQGIYARINTIKSDFQGQLSNIESRISVIKSDFQTQLAKLEPRLVLLEESRRNQNKLTWILIGTSVSAILTLIWKFIETGIQ